MAYEERRELTAEQFVALSTLLRLREGGQKEAARLVLVEGIAPTAAARMAGVTPSAVSNTLQSCRRGLELARAACSE